MRLDGSHREVGERAGEEERTLCKERPTRLLFRADRSRGELQTQDEEPERRPPEEMRDCELTTSESLDEEHRSERDRRRNDAHRECLPLPEWSLVSPVAIAERL